METTPLRPLTDAERTFLDKQKQQYTKRPGGQEIEFGILGIGLVSAVLLAFLLATILRLAGVPEQTARLVALVVATASALKALHYASFLRQKVEGWLQKTADDLTRATAEGAPVGLRETPDLLHKLYLAATAEELAEGKGEWIGSLAFTGGEPSAYLPAPRGWGK